jgi:hypothetical protein
MQTSHMINHKTCPVRRGALQERLIGDKAYDSNALDTQMAGLGVRMISSNRTGTRHTQDGR